MKEQVNASQFHKQVRDKGAGKSHAAPFAG
jgi:hypothetical protein